MEKLYRYKEKLYRDKEKLYRDQKEAGQQAGLAELRQKNFVQQPEILDCQ
jgi:hypothetical protein